MRTEQLFNDAPAAMREAFGDVAGTILAQLGGGRFLAMTGAHNLTKDDRTLNMKLPRGASNGINFVTITLEPNDTYTFTCYKVRGLNMREVYKLDMVYADNLQAAFVSATGLRVSL